MRISLLILLVASLTFSPSLASDEATQKGERLYGKFCASCHGPLETTEKPNRSYGRLLSSIRVVPSMYYLKKLSSSDLDAIVEATTQPERSLSSVRHKKSPQI